MCEPLDNGPRTEYGHSEVPALLQFLDHPVGPTALEPGCQSRLRVYRMFQQLCARRPLDNSTPLTHAPPTFLEQSLGYLRRSMCSGGEGDHPAPARRHGLPAHRPPRITPRDRRARGRPPRPFRNVDAPLAVVWPPPSPPCPVYRVVPLWPGAPKVRLFAVRDRIELVRLFPNGGVNVERSA